MTLYIAYSMASMNALASGDTADQARERAVEHHRLDSDEYLIVIAAESMADLMDFDGGAWRDKGRIVWRGSNELAQRA